MAVTHSKVSAVGDGADTSLVRPSDWNADHAISAAGLTIGADTNLYRLAANILKTDDALVVVGELSSINALIADGGYFFAKAVSATTAAWLYVQVTGEAGYRLQVIGDGTLKWGDGTNAADTVLYRSAANILKTDDAFHVGGNALTVLSTPGVNAQAVLQPGDAASGRLDWNSSAGALIASAYVTTGTTLLHIVDSSFNDRFTVDVATGVVKSFGTLTVVGQATQNAGKNVLDTDHTAAADPHPVYRLESEGESNVYIQDPGTFAIPTAGRLTQPVRLALSSTNRLTNAGTGRAALSDAPNDPSSLKYRAPGSDWLTSDEYVTESQRVELRGNSRRAMYGTGRSVITGFAPGGRLVLAGSGGGS